MIDWFQDLFADHLRTIISLILTGLIWLTVWNKKLENALPKTHTVLRTFFDLPDQPITDWHWGYKVLIWIGLIQSAGVLGYMLTAFLILEICLNMRDRRRGVNRSAPVPQPAVTVVPPPAAPSSSKPPHGPPPAP